MNDKYTRSIVLILSIIASLIILITTSSLAINIKVFMMILTLPMLVAATAYIISEKIDPVEDIETVEVDVDETSYYIPVTPDDAALEFEKYVYEWIILLDLDTEFDKNIKRIKHQANDIRSEIHTKAKEADERIAELCGMH